MKPIQKNKNLQILIKNQIDYDVNVHHHSSFRELYDHLNNNLIDDSVYRSSITTPHDVVLDATITINRLLIQTLYEYQFATE